MDVLELLGHLDLNPNLHLARLLVLLDAFSGGPGAGEIEGLTKLAKLDFLLRYPVILERALAYKNRSTSSVKVLDHERDCVESQMVRYRFGPWDHRYRQFLNLLVAKRLAFVRVDGRTVFIGLTEQGKRTVESLKADPVNEDLRRRAAILKAVFDMPAGKLMKFVYEVVPELTSLTYNQSIDP
jgi:hypothetical protein